MVNYMNSVRIVCRCYQLVSLKNPKNLFLQRHSYSQNLDVFISNMCLNNIRNRSKVVPNIPRAVVDNTVPSEINLSGPRKGSNSKKDPHIDNLIQKSIDANSLIDAISTMKKYRLVKKYPSSRTLRMLASISAQGACFDHLKLVQETYQEGFLAEYKWWMRLRHYYAEALWKSGDFKQAITILEELLPKHLVHLKKLSNKYTHLTRDILLHNKEEELDFLIDSVIRVAKEGIEHPASIVWYRLFLSPDGRKQFLSWDMLERCPEMKEFVITKVDSILLLSQKERGIDILKRLLEALLRLHAETEYTKVCGAILDLQCENSDLPGALETFRYIQEQEIVLKADTMLRYEALISEGRSPPSSKTKKDVAKSIQNILEL